MDAINNVNNIQIKRRTSNTPQPRKGFVSKKSEYNDAKEKFNSQEKKLKLLQLELSKKLQESNESTVIEELIIAQTPRYSNDSGKKRKLEFFIHFIFFRITNFSTCYFQINS